MILHNTDTSQ